jgi:pyruvate/2-oxoglutarate/acetoin dehydrogenase E1 component
MREIRYREAITEALREEMRRDDRVIVLGEDIGAYGGVFQVTAGFLKEFGPDRVFDTPISENTIVGCAVGAAMLGLRPVAEIMYIDFLPLALDALINQAAILPYAYGDQVELPMVVRTQGGSGSSAGPQHSKSLEGLVAHIPGLNVALPATPADAKGLLKTAIRGNQPAVIIEHKLLYNTRGPVEDGEHLVPFGVAAVRRLGRDVTIVATSRMVLEALAAAGQLAQEGIEAEVVDPRTLRPLDSATILTSVAKTHRALVVYEAWRTGGFGAEIAAIIAEEGFEYLDAPVRRLGGLDVPIPYSPRLESEIAPNRSTIAAQVRAMLA